MKGADVASIKAINASVSDWRGNRSKPVACPQCQTGRLEIEDRSTPPHAEWYLLGCSSCGFTATIQFPRGTPYITID